MVMVRVWPSLPPGTGQTRLGGPAQRGDPAGLLAAGHQA
jgi:hypothetical protein